MKRIRIISALILMVILSAGISSCVVQSKHDNGQHKGWFKNPNNPHNPKHGKSKGETTTIIIRTTYLDKPGGKSN